MATDWALIRLMMESAIASCERLEALGLTEDDRAAIGDVNGQAASVFDVLTSAWTYPEALRYQIIHERHAAGVDQAYVPEAARVLVNVAQACAELIGTGKVAPADQQCRAMARWYGEHALPLVEKAVQRKIENSSD